MKPRLVCLLIFMSIAVVACATTPDRVALKYWTKRAATNPGAARYVESSFQEQARKDALVLRSQLKETHPDLRRYRFDFSDLRVKIETNDGRRARVVVTGTARAFNRRGDLVDQVRVNDPLELWNVGLGWVVDYSWKVDRIAREALKDLAEAQKAFHRDRQYFARRLEDLGNRFHAPYMVSVDIIQADGKSWRAMARYRRSRKAFVYDSKAGGLLPNPIIVKH